MRESNLWCVHLLPKKNWDFEKGGVKQVDIGVLPSGATVKNHVGLIEALGSKLILKLAMWG